MGSGDSETVEFPGWSNTETCFWSERHRIITASGDPSLIGTFSVSNSREQCITPTPGATYTIEFQFEPPGTLLDSASNTMWQDDIGVSSFQGTWDEATAYCANLDLAGFTDWTLPDLLRYEESVAANIIQRAVNRTSATDKFYWTSTDVPTGGGSDGSAFLIDEAGDLLSTPNADGLFAKTRNTVGARCSRFSI